MASITRAMRRIKENLAGYLEPTCIEGLCRGFGHTWRGRILDPVTTLHLFILQILHGNTACSHLAHLAGTLQPAPSSRRPFTASAYCQARRRLPIELIAAPQPTLRMKSLSLPVQEKLCPHFQPASLPTAHLLPVSYGNPNRAPATAGPRPPPTEPRAPASGDSRRDRATHVVTRPASLPCINPPPDGTASEFFCSLFHVPLSHFECSTFRARAHTTLRAFVTFSTPFGRFK